MWWTLATWLNCLYSILSFGLSNRLPLSMMKVWSFCSLFLFPFSLGCFCFSQPPGSKHMFPHRYSCYPVHHWIHWENSKFNIQIKDKTEAKFFGQLLSLSTIWMMVVIKHNQTQNNKSLTWLWYLGWKMLLQVPLVYWKRTCLLCGTQGIFNRFICLFWDPLLTVWMGLYLWGFLFPYKCHIYPLLWTV